MNLGYFNGLSLSGYTNNLCNYQYNASLVQTGNSLPSSSNDDYRSISLNSEGTIAAACIFANATAGVYIGSGTGATQWTWSARQSNNSLPGASNYWNTVSLNSAGNVCVALIGSGTDNDGIYIGTGSGANQWTWSARQSNNSLPGSNSLWNSASLNSAGTVCVASIGDSAKSGIYIGTGSGATQWTWTAVQANNSLPGANNGWRGVSLNSAGTLCVACIGATTLSINDGVYIGTGSGATQWTWSARQSNNSLPGASNIWRDVSLNSAGTVCAALIGSSYAKSGIYIGAGYGASQWTWSAVQSNNSLPGASNNWVSVSLNSAGTVATSCISGFTTGGIYIGRGDGATQWTWSSRQSNNSLPGASNSWTSVYLNSAGTVCTGCMSSGGPKGGVHILSLPLDYQYAASAVQSNNSLPTSSNYSIISLNSAGTVCAVVGGGPLYIGTGSGATQWNWSSNNTGGTDNGYSVALNSAGTVCAVTSAAGGLYIGTGSGATQWTWSATQSALPTVNWHGISLNSAGNTCAVCAYPGGVYIGKGSGATQWTWSAVQSNNSLPTSANWWNVSLNSAGTVCAAIARDSNVYIGVGSGANQWTWASQFSGTSNWLVCSLNSEGTVCAACAYGGGVYIGNGSGATQWTWSAAQSGIVSNGGWHTISLNSAGTVCIAAINGTGAYIGTGSGATQWNWTAAQTALPTGAILGNWYSASLNSAGNVAALCALNGGVYMLQASNTRVITNSRPPPYNITQGPTSYSSSSITPPAGTTYFTIVIIAGAGGGGSGGPYTTVYGSPNRYGGGGGSGATSGTLTVTSIPYTGGNITSVSVGSGGTGGTFTPSSSLPPDGSGNTGIAGGDTYLTYNGITYRVYGGGGGNPGGAIPIPTANYGTGGSVNGTGYNISSTLPSGASSSYSPSGSAGNNGTTGSVSAAGTGGSAVTSGSSISGSGGNGASSSGGSADPGNNGTAGSVNITWTILVS